ncbi:MAG: hypothetical protein WD294_01940 [Phycisphaeraceae bacterium]
MHVRNGSLTVGAMLLLVLAVGCNGVSFKGTDGSADAALEAWPFKPVSMRIHPFTSLQPVEGEEALILEVRIEMFDQLGDVTKGVGNWRFELYTQPGRASQRSRERVEVWEAAMTELVQNERHYDPITRTYAFKLHLEEQPPIDQPLSVVAQFNTPSGERLIADSEVSYEVSP